MLEFELELGVLRMGGVGFDVVAMEGLELGELGAGSETGVKFDVGAGGFEVGSATGGGVGEGTVAGAGVAGVIVAGVVVGIQFSVLLNSERTCRNIWSSEGLHSLAFSTWVGTLAS